MHRSRDTAHTQLLLDNGNVIKFRNACEALYMKHCQGKKIKGQRDSHAK